MKTSGEKEKKLNLAILQGKLQDLSLENPELKKQFKAI